MDKKHQGPSATHGEGPYVPTRPACSDQLPTATVPRLPDYSVLPPKGSASSHSGTIQNSVDGTDARTASQTVASTAVTAFPLQWIQEI